jgi:hypothetical protein
MSEGSRDRLQTEVSDEEILAQIAEVLAIARDRIYEAYRHKRGKIDPSRIAVILNPDFDETNKTYSFRLDGDFDFSLEKHDENNRPPTRLVDVSLTRFPLPCVGSSIASEGIRAKISTDPKIKPVLEYHLREKDGKGGLLPPVKLSPRDQLGRARSLVSSI